MDKEKLVWTNNLSVNHPKIDAQHRHLFDLINELAGEKAEKDPEEYARLLSCLTDYFRIHFFEEEAYMEQYGYPDLEKHKVEHVRFIYRICMFNVGYLSSIPTDAKLVHLFTRHWVVAHVMKLDMEYRDFIAEKLRNNCK